MLYKIFRRAHVIVLAIGDREDKIDVGSKVTCVACVASFGCCRHAGDLGKSDPVYRLRFPGKPRTAGTKVFDKHILFYFCRILLLNPLRTMYNICYIKCF
jgi:hypothetical protein